VALVALGAAIHTARPEGGRTLALEDLYCLPGATPHIETVLGPGEVIAAVHVPAGSIAHRSVYLKIRDRASFDWALVSVAVGLDLDGETIREARVGAGGVGTVPWRMRDVERALSGQGVERAALTRAAARAVEGARATPHNAFKLTLLQRAIVRAVEEVGGQPTGARAAAGDRS
jgi:xanthine dehydrogenase YagS FAD-binding subunit